MSDDKTATRRAFLKSGAILAAPIAVGAPAVAMAADDSKARLAALEDEKAIRDLHASWMRHINNGAPDVAATLFANPKAAAQDEMLRSIVADHSGETDAIAIATDGQRASGTYACTVAADTMIPPTTTLAQMAHAQGEGYVRETQRRIVKADYVKTGTGWAIAALELASA